MGLMLVGIAGRARTGKDTAAQWLSDQAGFSQYAFANPLKSGLAVMLGLSAEDFEGERKEAVIPWLGKSPRQLMQSLGTEWGRECVSPDVWVKALEQRVEWAMLAREGFSGAPLPPYRVVISDVRFESEAAWIRSRGGVVVHLSRVGAALVNSHVSEVGLEVVEGDQVINNDGSIQDLIDQLWALVDWTDEKTRSMR